MARVLVAGATGYLGRYVVRAFKARGCFVRALVRSRSGLGDLADDLDEVVQGEVTKPETVVKVCDGIDVVFSSVGITRQRDGLTFQDVDYQGNKNLLDVALQTGVHKFVYVSVFDGPNLRHLAIVKAHEDFVDALAASGIDYAVVRPNGFFSDMSEFLKMAGKGRVYLFGKGGQRVNPIHGADLAEVCVDAVDDTRREIDVGGPEILTHHEIAELAFRALGKEPRITRLPFGVLRASVGLTRIFSRHRADLMAFFASAIGRDVVAPQTGTHTLGDDFAERAATYGTS